MTMDENDAMKPVPIIVLIALLVAVVVIWRISCGPTPTVVVDAYWGVDENTVRTVAKETLERADVTTGVYRATMEEARISPDSVKLSLCISGPNFGTLCEEGTWLKNEHADGSIFGTIWVKAGLAQKIRRASRRKE